MIVATYVERFDDSVMKSGPLEHCIAIVIMLALLLFLVLAIEPPKRLWARLLFFIARQLYRIAWGVKYAGDWLYVKACSMGRGNAY